MQLTKGLILDSRREGRNIFQHRLELALIHALANLDLEFKPVKCSRK